MDRKTKWIAGGALGPAVIGGGTGIAIAGAGHDDQSLTGSALDKAGTAALEYTGGGTVVQTEAGDGGVAYDVEIRLGDGSAVEVGLDAGFNVTGQEGDDVGPGEDPGPNED